MALGMLLAYNIDSAAAQGWEISEVMLQAELQWGEFPVKCFTTLSSVTSQNNMNRMEAIIILILQKRKQLRELKYLFQIPGR